MKLGEWLLTKHPEHVQQLSLLTVRLDQCKNAYSSVSETIEKLILQQQSSDEPPSKSIENIHDEITRIFQQLMYLELKIHRVNDYIGIYGIILAGLPKNDTWFIENHFDKKRPVAELINEPFPDGNTYSKSMVHNMKNRIIDHVTELCDLMVFCPPDFKKDGHNAMDIRWSDSGQ